MAASRHYRIIRNDFKKVSIFATKAAHDAVQDALDEGEKTANIGIERGNTARDYNLPADVDKEGTSYHGGKIVYDHPYGPYFEYGFYNVPAMPFMRSAGRKMKTVFKKEMGDLFKGYSSSRRFRR